MQTEKPSINEEYLLDQIAQMDQIILKALGAKELATAQLQHLRSEKNSNGKEQAKETGSGPQPGRTEDEYVNGNNCRPGSCD